MRSTPWHTQSEAWYQCVVARRRGKPFTLVVVVVLYKSCQFHKCVTVRKFRARQSVQSFELTRVGVVRAWHAPDLQDAP